MAYTTINKSTDHFNTLKYTGNGSTQSITGVGFQPDWVWIKSRGAADNHNLFDATRGANKYIYSNDNQAEVTDTNRFNSFDSDGFTLGDDEDVNENGDTLVSWNWKANGTGSSNTDGSINTTYTSVNTTAGFSICKWTGTGSAGTIGHGLGATPGMIMFKNLSTSNAWVVWNKTFNARTRLVLNGTNAVSTSQTGFMNDTLPTSSVIHLKDDSDTNGSGNQMIAYVFAEKTGYSKFSSYTGNGNANGTFVYTGFKPAWLMIKQSSASGESWFMYDNKRSVFNVVDDALNANSSTAEFTGSGNNDLDILSNGFKLRATDSRQNASGATYIYMAFAEAPIVGSNNIPCTAR